MREASQDHHQSDGLNRPKAPRHGPIEKANTIDPTIDPPPAKPPYYGGPKGEGQGQEHQGHKGHKQ